MAAALIGGAFLSASLQVLFDRLASQKVIDFFNGRNLNNKLLEKLKIMMISVEGVLDDAEEKQITRPAVRKWLDELKDAFYEADDLLDEIAYAALGSEMGAGPQTSIDSVRKFFSSQGQLEKEIESKLVEILEKLEYLVNQKNVLGLKEGIGEKPLSQKIPTTSVMDESGVYGREEDKEVIVQLLLSDDANYNNLGLIPIIGMGGIGKTTLAQFVYNDSRVKEQFGFKAWISVSEEFDVLKVTRDILNGVTSTIHDINTLDHFQVALKNQLADKKFLLVFDDVWNDHYDHWDILLKPLKTGAKGSKIIITTRLQSVASVMGVVQTHHVKELSDEECWLLFSKHAFDGRRSSANPNLEKIGREIVRKCNGLPLAAKSLGGLLRSKRKPEEWERVLKNNIWNLPRDNILPALRLSYHFLPSPLKQCFAYCAIFPKGYVFRKEELVLLWMGEGFLGQAGFSMEREVIGEEYFDDLLSRSFFNPNKDVWLRPGFSMHDLINDLARSVAGEFCFRLDDDDDDSCKVTPRTRHLSYVLRKNLLPRNSKGITSAPLLRTFIPVHLSASRKYHDIDEKVIHDTLRKLVHLRVLSLSWYDSLLKIDDSISNLKHLRHLNLSRTSIKILPESLCSLYHLEILLLVGCYKLVELPLHLGNLANLCILDIEWTYLQKTPPHMGRLTKLQKLSYFMIAKESGYSIQELGNLHHLRGGLVIRNLENVMQVEEALRANIKGKIYLKNLELNWKGEVNDSLHARRLLEQLEPHENVETLTISGYGSTRFPDWIDGGSGLSRVVTLKLDGCRHVCQLPPLGQLVHLKKLSIIDFPEIVSIGPEFYGGCTSMKKPFQCLEVLRFANMPQWQEWVMCGNEEEDFHLLQELYIINCPAFKHSLPQHLPSLTKLKIRMCERLVASLPRVPRIITVKLDDVTLRDGYWLSTFRSQSPLLERIEQLGCGLFNNLQVVRIEQCDFLKCFCLESFSNLKHLHIEDCPNFEMINGNYISLISLGIKQCPNFVSFPKVGLETPNLKTLWLMDCSNLKFLPEFMHSLLYSLEELVIRNCPKLESFPEGGLPSKLRLLEIVSCTKLINGRNQWNLYCFSSLLRFEIGGYRHVECFPEESLLPPTLTSLEIRDFPNLKSLQYKGYQHLTSLQSLTIDNCPELQLLPEEGLPSSLTSLKIWDLQNLEYVVNLKIQQLANLKELSISNCPKLKSVPEEGLPSTITSLTIQDFTDLESLNSNGLQNLTSLKELSIENCPKLHSLPEGGLPSSLSYLFIQHCDLLEKRCQREKGEDWPKISHISDIYISECY
ncbi:hypothetical protein K2173_010857 [Erythroxylum novogranatense]|uniref:Disease resistance RPP13-like protein 1 n=1 Tax=Erythroxylum novogranatense TaxID=1862640 RepID=A0AAV8SZV6_9ROSI|nr:hypothetical protein K2173_010857 [Erythroxylum novogranatense]